MRFSPGTVISFVVNTGNSCILKQWPPISVSYRKDTEHVQCTTASCLRATDWSSERRREPGQLLLKSARGRIHSAAYIKLPEGRCWVKYERWPRRDPTCRGYHTMKVLSMKMLRNEAKSLFLISNVGYLIYSLTIRRELKCHPLTNMTTWLFPDRSFYPQTRGTLSLFLLIWKSHVSINCT